MSKSDPDRIGRIEISDSAEEMRDKIKKAVTDFTGTITYEPAKRRGVANLIDLCSAVSGHTPEFICESAAGLNTGQFKMMVADLVIEKFAPIAETYFMLRKSPEFLDQVLKEGSARAQVIAEKTIKEVKELMGLL